MVNRTCQAGEDFMAQLGMALGSRNRQAVAAEMALGEPLVNVDVAMENHPLTMGISINMNQRN